MSAKQHNIHKKQGIPQSWEGSLTKEDIINAGGLDIAIKRVFDEIERQWGFKKEYFHFS